jgi:ribosomal protein L11 methyltransferase
MDNQFYYVEFYATPAQYSQLVNMAISDFESSGAEEFALIESEVDEILGERSYSGGDIPLEILEEVEDVVNLDPLKYKIYFNDKNNADLFMQAVYEIDSGFLMHLKSEKIEDWNQEWRKHYAPIKVADALTIMPSWEMENATDEVLKKSIYIYPGMGFGTGDHETTHLCLKKFLQFFETKNIKKCLDFGCGSGILGIAALFFLNETEVDFLDIDEKAIGNCEQNLMLNNFQIRKHRLLVASDAMESKSTYDLVFANILKDVLLAQAKSIFNIMSDNSVLILSGILNDQVLEVLKCYEDLGLKKVDSESMKTGQLLF